MLFAVILIYITLLWVHAKVFVLLRDENLCLKPSVFLFDVNLCLISSLGNGIINDSFLFPTAHVSRSHNVILQVEYTNLPQFFYPKPYQGYMQIALVK